MNGKKSFLLHHDSLEIIEKLTDEQTGKVFKAMIAFNLNGEILELDFPLELVFTPFKNQFIRDHKKWEAVSKKRTESINKRWETENKKT